MTDDCGALGLCAHPDDAPGCGIGPPDFEDECGPGLGDCADGRVCDFIDDGCGGSHQGCVDPCVDNSGCADGELCRAGRCETPTCQTDGFLCPAHTACGVAAPDPVVDDDRGHGCVAIACAVDADCDGVCVQGRCAPDFGTCELPRP